MPELFLAALGVTLLILLLQKLEHAETKLLIKTLKWTLVGVMILAGIYLTLVGRLLQVAAIAVLLILLLRQDVQQWMKGKPPPLPLPHPLTKNEAAALLKVDLNASSVEIEEAFKKIKPKDSTQRDRLIQARDVLLKGK
ncbi:MAG: hypothetical protein BGO67_04555 [Alphaproteobacteria bacterium 41-28]|nr:MAG: hypothetical protein BGO67_04555 [Alphaproteobacteria bacterium 41-28]